MFTFVLLNALMGAALGMRFKIGVLFPAAIFSAFIVVGVSLAAGHAPLQTLIVLLISMTSLQFGYVLNAVGYILPDKRAAGAAPATVKEDEVRTAFNQLDRSIADLMTVSSQAQTERHESDATPDQRQA